jgi:hypothetical protein
MTCETTGAALLDIACETLVEDVLPALGGDARFRALMVASAMRMTQREVEQAPAVARARKAVLDAAAARLAEPVASMQALCVALRAHKLASDETIHLALRTLGAIETSITKPSALSPEDENLVTKVSLAAGDASSWTSGS